MVSSTQIPAADGLPDGRGLVGALTADSASISLEVGQLLTDQFRLAGDVADFTVREELSRDSGYFRLGPAAICYGQCSSGAPARSVTEPLHDAREQVVINRSSVQLPFDPVQVLNNLRCERYYTANVTKMHAANSPLRRMYYLARPFIGSRVRRQLQKLHFQGWDKAHFPKWPVDTTVDNILEALMVYSMKARKVTSVPFIWFWPNRATSCTVVTNDVETVAGRDFCPHLMDLNDSFGIKSSFQVVPEKRYPVPESFLENIRERGFEVNVQDLNHDGRLFSDRQEFLRRVERINCYAEKFAARGFRAAVLYRNPDWYDALDFSYDMSIPNVAHLEAQRGGCCTVLPFFIGNVLELPVTTTQDYSLFHVLNDYSIRLWKEQISLIRGKHGLISFIIHPDYIIDDKARCVYRELLHYLADLRSQGETWIPLPGEVADWWRLRSKLRLVKTGNSWRIEGQGSERASVAYAILRDEKIEYEFN
jgi:hypothetical protein